MAGGRAATFFALLALFAAVAIAADYPPPYSPPYPKPTPTPSPSPPPPSPKPTPAPYPKPTPTPSPSPPPPSPKPTPSPSPPPPSPKPTPSPSPPPPSPKPTPAPYPKPTPTPSPSPPPPSPKPTPPTPSTPKPAPYVHKVKCQDTWYPKCYGVETACPSSCATNCVMDCKTCKSVCPCDKPGGMCQDPRFIGGDGVMFYFHGQKDKDFCLVSDESVHVNAHFIGKRGAGMTRDFTWVQAIAVLFGEHTLHVAAKNVSTSAWDDKVDQLTVAFDGSDVSIPSVQGASSKIPSAGVEISRIANANAFTVTAEDKFVITARAVCIGEEESRVHKYDITDDCFAHLEVTFKFLSLSPDVEGVLGRTYSAKYSAPTGMLRTAMPVVGGEHLYAASGLFTPDCKVAKFSRSASSALVSDDFASVSCSSAMSGRGIVCRR